MRLNKIRVNQNLMELIQHGSRDFPIQYYFDLIEDYELGYIPWHWHEEFELLSSTSGNVSCFIGNSRFELEVGDGLFVNSGILHQYESIGDNQDTIIENILFAPEFIAPPQSHIYVRYILPFLSTLDVMYIVLRRTNPWQQIILDNLDEIYSLWNSQEEMFELKIHRLVNEIWQLLWENRDELELEKSSSGGSSKPTQIRMKQMITFIEMNFQQSITLSEIAASANISKSEALRCFKNYIDTSPIDFLIEYRLHQSIQLLLTTNQTITDIAQRCGFSSTGYFGRRFKQMFSLSPREYRNKFNSNVEKE